MQCHDRGTHDEAGSRVRSQRFGHCRFSQVRSFNGGNGRLSENILLSDFFVLNPLPFSHSEHYYKDMSIRCKACPAGKFLADDADDATQHDSARDCVECKTKTYSLGGERFCSQCKVGTYELVSDQGQITGCQQCPSGYFSGSVGSVVCSSCEAGKYQNRVGLPYCLPCVPGRFTDTVGLSEWYGWVVCFSGLWNAPR